MVSTEGGASRPRRAAAGGPAGIALAGRFVYTWTAEEASGPGPGDPSSLVWWYHSHVDEPVETNLGLLGPSS